MYRGFNDNILSLIENTPDLILINIAERVKQRRLELNWTQQYISTKSGVPLPTYRRFERTGEISLRGLIMIAFSMDLESYFDKLFEKRVYNSIDEIINIKEKIQRKRGRIDE